MTASGEKATLMAVWVESIHDADQPYFYDGYICSKSADVRGSSPDSKITLELETNALSRRLFEGFERLSHHGFTVVEVPEEWQDEYRRPQGWRDDLINKALEQTACAPQPHKGGAQVLGYDVELAHLVLRALNKAYPQSVQLTQIKHELDNEPSDTTLLNALDALVGDGYIDGKYLRGKGKLRATANIKISGEGRRHLQDEMRRKTTQSKQAFHVNDASAFILTQLLAEFRERGLTSEDLRSTYEGLTPTELKQAGVAKGITEVDFDLAISDLINHNLIKTGPMAAYDNPPNSFVTVIGLYSKNEYSYLTVDGYKEAVKTESTKARVPGPSPAVIHGDQIINYGHAAAIGRQSHGQINHQGGWSEQQLHSLADELEQLRLAYRKIATSREVLVLYLERPITQQWAAARS